ncbi:YPDG domain-containing protein [Corynebacterium riegelii]
MQGMNIARRRGTSVAAAALSLALVVPFAQPVVSPAAAPAAVAQEAQEAQASPTVNPESKIIDADMIASGRVTKAANLTDAHGVGKGLISGHVYLTGVAGNPGAAYDNGNVKLDGITVYAQFRDKDGSYSPIFSAKTHTLPDVVGGNGGQGTFAFGTGDTGITWTDKLGREHTYTARTDQMHRIWVEPFTNERGNRVEMFRQANGFVPGSFNLPADAPLGSFVASDGNMQLTAAFLREVAPNHKESWLAAKGDKLVEDPEGPIASASTQTKVPNTVSGRVWLETGGPDKGIVATGPAFNSIDEPADGYTVYASTLTKDGAAANQKLRETYKNDPNKIAQATKEMLEAHPEYILKTVYGKTNNKGEYTLRFGNYEKGQIREDILNPNHLFVWVEDQNGVVQNGYTGFHTPTFQRFNFGGNFRPAAIPGENQLPINFNGVPFQNLNSLYNVHYAIMPYAPASITADYNATDKPAAPGVTVTPEFHGNLSTLPSKVEWRDAKGKVLKTCDLDQSKGIKAQVAACTFDIPDDAKKGDFFNVVLVSGGNDVSAWTVLVTRDADEYTPSYEDKLVVPGEETKSAPTFTKVDEDGNETEEKVDAPEGSKFAIPGDFKAPEGYVVTIDENTGEITVTFPDKSKLNKDTVEEFDVPVVVTYPDGSTDDATAKFKLDTDGDGTPDTEDPDDDGDGIPDEKEKEDKTNPKVPNQNLDYEPEYKDGSGKPGEDVKVDKPTFKDKNGKDTTAPEGTKFTPGENTPDGVTIDENTGEITVTIPEDAKPGDKITVPVVVTYPDGTKDNVDVTVTVTDKDADLYEPSYEGKLVVPGKETKSSPTLTDKDGKDATAPEGSTFKITDGFTAPEGYEVTIDENTGEITVTFPDKSKLNADTVEEFDVPVTVTYPDKSTDNTTANFKLDTDGDGTPDTEDPDDDGDGIPDEKEKEDKTNPKVPNQNQDYEPGYEDGSGKPGEDVTVPAPEFKDKEGNPAEAPEGTKFTPGENAPDGVTIDENTGEITVTVPEDAKPGDKITVPVEVTYPDGSKDNVDVTVTVEEPDAKDKDADTYEPGYEDGSGKPGEDVKVPAPEFKDKDGNPTTAPEGTTFGPGKNAPDGVKVNENTGEITVTVPEDANPGDKITVPVEVTYPDGSKDNVDVTVTVEQPNVGDRDKPEIDTGKCIASALGFGLPMIALLPLGLASQVDVPGLTPIANELSARLEQANSQIQQQIGVYNPQLAGQVAEINARLKSVGADLFTVATSLALITAGILTGTMIYKNCVPDGTTDVTVEDLKLKGSSGKEYELSSKKDTTTTNNN